MPALTLPGRADCRIITKLVHLGFIDAAHDYHQSITSGDLLKPISCPSHQVTRQEVRDVFLMWASSNGALLDTESPIHGLMRAASAKWPCP